jgi:hypothetical protein
MGTVRVHFRRLMSVSAVKMSVTGLDVYLLEYAILDARLPSRRAARTSLQM